MFPLPRKRRTAGYNTEEEKLKAPTGDWTLITQNETTWVNELKCHFVLLLHTSWKKAFKSMTVHFFHFLQITVMLSNNVDRPAHSQPAIKRYLWLKPAVLICSWVSTPKNDSSGLLSVCNIQLEVLGKLGA